jgi:hypothetical protein
MLFKDILTVSSGNQTKSINSICEQDSYLLLKQMVCAVTTGLSSVEKVNHSHNTPMEARGKRM